MYVCMYVCSSFPVQVHQHLWARIEAFGKLYVINNPEKLTFHRFRHVFHQARHTYIHILHSLRTYHTIHSVHTYIHTYIYTKTFIHTCMQHTYTYMYAYTHVCWYIHTYIRKCIRTLTSPYKHTYIHTYIHTFLCIGPSSAASGVHSLSQVPPLGQILELDFQVERVRNIPLQTTWKG